MTMTLQIDALDVPTLTVRDGVALRLNLIGTMQAVAEGGGSVLPLGRKTRALLAILALSAPRPIVRSRLAELLWSRRLEEQARASLRQEIHRLLEALGSIGPQVLRITRDHLALRPETVWVDAHEVMAANRDDPSALALLDGDLMSGFETVDPAFGEWLSTERERLRDHARSVAETQLDETAAAEAMLPIARQLIGIDRAHERAWRAVIRCHAARGERTLAIQAYERCRMALAEIMAAQPAAETQQLIAEIRAGGSRDLAPGRTGVQVAPGRHAGARVGVLKLQSFTTGAAEEALALGLAEETTAALALADWLTLVAPAALAHAGTRDGGQLRGGLGLDYLLDGSVQRGGRRLRVALRLLDLREGGQVVWARHFDMEDDDLLASQDEISSVAAAQLEPELQLLEGRRAGSQPPGESSAQNLVLRSIPLIVRLRRDEFADAGAMLTRAMQVEPDYSAAHALRGIWAALSLSQGWSAAPERTAAEAVACAERAITLDPRDARALSIAGHVGTVVSGRPRQALELHERALSLNPCAITGWGLSGICHAFVGNLEEAERCFARLQQLSPVTRHAFFYDTGRIPLALARRDYRGAVQLGRRATELNPFYVEGLQHYLAALGHAGLHADAAAVLRRLCSLRPGFNVQLAMMTVPFEQTEEVEHYMDGLLAGGLPSGLGAGSRLVSGMLGTS